MAKNELKIFIGLHRAVNYMDKINARVHREYGLTTGQFAVLEALYHKGDMTIGCVQEKILSTSGTIPLIIKNLEDRKLLNKCVDKNDKRKNILSITEDGRRLMDKAYPASEKAIIEFMDAWSDEEQEILVRLLKKYGGEKFDKRS